MNLRRVRWLPLTLALIYLSICGWCIASMAGCAKRAIVESIVAHNQPPAAPHTVAEADDRVTDLRVEIGNLEHDLAVKRADLKSAQSQQSALAEDALRTKASWAAGLLALAGVACGVLVFVVPIGKSWLTGASLGCFAGVALALAFRALVPFLVYAGWALLIGAIAFAIWKIRHLKKAVASNADAFDMLETEVLNSHVGAELANAVQSVKAAVAVKQTEAGVRNVIAAIRGKPKPIAGK